MQPDIKDLREHYASLSDDALSEIDRSELTQIAQRCYDEELAKRNVVPEADNDEPEWSADAACACSFDSFPGNDAAPEVEQAHSILESAEIPCHIKITQMDESQGGPQPHYLYELMIPGALILPATSVLDKELFNPRTEAEWRNHLAELSDEDFEALNPEDLTAGLVDRVERLERAYNEELARRNEK